MGIVKISDELHEAAKLMAKAMSRSINSQAEYWMRIGKLIEENQSITYAEVLKILVDQASLDNSDFIFRYASRNPRNACGRLIGCSSLGNDRAICYCRCYYC